MKNIVLPALVLLLILSQPFAGQSALGNNNLSSTKDFPFIQESHIAFPVGDRPLDNQVRAIAVDRHSTVWIATAGGAFRKIANSRIWEPIVTGPEKGPAYAVLLLPNDEVLIGTWNGLYRITPTGVKSENGLRPPISVLCSDKDGAYALGPLGIWRLQGDQWVAQPYKTSQKIYDAATNERGELWVATGAGLFKCFQGKTTVIQEREKLISCYTHGLAFEASGDLWAGTMGGVSILRGKELVRKISPQEGLSSAMVNRVRQAPDGTMWVGTQVGVVRFHPGTKPSLLFSRRWLMDNRVNDIAFDPQGNCWIATPRGVSEIVQEETTLKAKEQNYYHQLMIRHIRPPWTCGLVRLETPGDSATWRPSDDDNDGEYTAGYLAMESFRYAVTGSDEAHQKARKAFEFLKFLQTVTGTEGFFARSIVPVDWKKVNDPNIKYSDQDIAEELVKDPRFKPVEVRWHPSADGKWLWKGDTSTDEMDGHMMGYFYFYTLAASPEEKVEIRNHVLKIVDNLIKTGYNLVDIDGTHTHWAVWSPDQLNHNPDWASERSINSLELLTYLKFAYFLSNDQRYEKEYRRLIDQEGYLDNVKQLNQKNPAWQIYFDRTLEGYLFPILISCEKDHLLSNDYRKLMEEWMENQPSGENLINNLAYAFALGKEVNKAQTIDFLRRAPLDLMDWPIDHTLREDIHLVRYPILEELQIDQLPPPEIRATVRWDKNPWAARQGNLSQLREPVFWLFPYWMARYLKQID